MNKMQQQVHVFKQKLNGTDDWSVCHKLIEEESEELISAMANPLDEASIVDGMCDLIYVVFYLAEVMKIDLEPYFDEVQRTNLLKEPGSGAHKIRKPEGWQPPRIAEMLAEGIGVVS